jgi:hypothetical protein
MVVVDVVDIGVQGKDRAFVFLGFRRDSNLECDVCVCSPTPETFGTDLIIRDSENSTTKSKFKIWNKPNNLYSTRTSSAKEMARAQDSKGLGKPSNVTH